MPRGHFLQTEVLGLPASKQTGILNVFQSREQTVWQKQWTRSHQNPLLTPSQSGFSLFALIKSPGHEDLGAFCASPIACLTTASPRSFSISNLGSFHRMTSIVSAPPGIISAAGGGCDPKSARTASRTARTIPPSLCLAVSPRFHHRHGQDLPPLSQDWYATP